MNSTKNRSIVLAVIEAKLPVPEAAQRFGVSPRWVRVLLARYREGGLEAVDSRSRRPHTSPNATGDQLIEQILSLRAELISTGLDAGAESIYGRLDPALRPSVSTIWRILKRHQQVDPQPQKRPRSSWHRFEAPAPNGMWQSDFTHCRLADGTDLEVISWLDDHSRYLLHISAHARVTGVTVIETFTTTADSYGLPASTLTDNAMVYTTRLAGGGAGKNNQPNGFEYLLADLGIVQKNGAPGHPTTQGKIERFHQTLKRWLAAAEPATTTPRHCSSALNCSKTSTTPHGPTGPWTGAHRSRSTTANRPDPKTASGSQSISSTGESDTTKSMPVARSLCATPAPCDTSPSADPTARGAY